MAVGGGGVQRLFFDLILPCSAWRLLLVRRSPILPGAPSLEDRHRPPYASPPPPLRAMNRSTPPFNNQCYPSATKKAQHGISHNQDHFEPLDMLNVTGIFPRNGSSAPKLETMSHSNVLLEVLGHIFLDNYIQNQSLYDPL